MNKRLFQLDDEPNLYIGNDWKSPFPSILNWLSTGFQVQLQDTLQVFFGSSTVLRATTTLSTFFAGEPGISKCCTSKSFFGVTKYKALKISSRFWIIQWSEISSFMSVYVYICWSMLILSLSDNIGLIAVDCSFQTCFARGLKLAISTIASRPRRSPSQSGLAWGDQTHLLEVKRKLTNQILTFYLHSTNMKLSIIQTSNI